MFIAILSVFVIPSFILILMSVSYYGLIQECNDFAIDYNRGYIGCWHEVNNSDIGQKYCFYNRNNKFKEIVADNIPGAECKYYIQNTEHKLYLEETLKNISYADSVCFSIVGIILIVWGITICSYECHPICEYDSKCCSYTKSKYECKKSPCKCEYTCCDMKYVWINNDKNNNTISPKSYQTSFKV